MGFRFFSSSTIHKIRLISKVSFSHTRKPLYLSPTFQARIPQFQSNLNNDEPHFKIPKRLHFGHSHGHEDHNKQIGEEGERIFRLGLASDIGLAAGKAITGYLSGSTAIIADAAHSVSDVVLSGVALWSFKVARAPKDREHPYGHGKFESLGALGISCMLFATAGGIAWHALNIVLEIYSTSPEIFHQPLTHEHTHSHNHGGHHHGLDMNHPVLALSMTTLSICVKEGLYWITRRAGERTGSGLMKANAWHHRADAISSVVALIGVGGSIIGVRGLDPLAGLVVSGMILKAGIETGYQSVMELVDAAIPMEHLEPVRCTIQKVDGVKGCHRLRGRRAGSSLYLDVHIEVDPFLSVSAAHDVGEHVRRQIHKSHPEVTEVFIHIDPSYSTPVLEDLKQIHDQKKNVPLDQSIKDIVSDTLASKFSEKMVVEHITHHSLQGKVLLQVEVSMRPEMMIQEAMALAEEAKRVTLEALPSVVQVGLQLRLGKPIQKSKGDPQTS